MDIVKQRRIFYIFSGILIAASLLSIGIWGLKLGIDFTGGSILEVEFQEARPPVTEIDTLIAPLELGETRLQPTGERGLILRSRHLSEDEHQDLLAALGDVQEKRFDTVGPIIGRELRRDSIIAIVLVNTFILIYIAWAFRKVSRPVASWKYGVTTIVALAHDVLIPTGLFAALGHFLGFEVDTLFVTALLTILGFSVHDTIVVFDRIREHLRKSSHPNDFQGLVTASIRETITRSINTSLTVVLALLAVYFFGGETTRLFSLTLIAGIVVGTYSSIFIASPLLVTWHRFYEKA